MCKLLSKGLKITISLDLGCGTNPKNTFNADQIIGIDIREDLDKSIYKADLAIEPIPFPANFFDFVTAHDFIEHIPRVIYNPTRRNCFIELMNEVYRVLKTGGLFLSHTPAFPRSEAFRDPTHVNIIAEDTFNLYFDDKNRWATAYGFNGYFEIIQQEWNGPHLLTVLKKAGPPQL